LKGEQPCSKCGVVFRSHQIAAHETTCCAENTSLLPFRDLESKTEVIWTSRCLELLWHCNWLAFHDWDSRTNRKGFPDIVATRNGVTFWAEQKMGMNKPTIDQVKWLDGLSLDKPRLVYLWRYPDDNDIVTMVATSPRSGLTTEQLDQLYATCWVSRRKYYVKARTGEEEKSAT
jgi:hypothetical protein